MGLAAPFGEVGFEGAKPTSHTDPALRRSSSPQLKHGGENRLLCLRPVCKGIPRKQLVFLQIMSSLHSHCDQAHFSVHMRHVHADRQTFRRTLNPNRILAPGTCTT